jgi:tRNA(Ile2) C34 agmatinyltransferase TiaS
VTKREQTTRKCRYCGGRFLAARGTVVLACPSCAPTIEDAIREAAKEKP